MIKSFLTLIVICIFFAGAAEPNYVKIIVYNVDGSNNNMVTTSYNDGLGRPTEEKLQLPPDQSTIPPTQKDRVSCTFYDDAGRPQYTTKSFVDLRYTGSYLPGERSDPSIADQLKASNYNDTRAYSETVYWDDPLGRPKAVKGPGAAYVQDEGRSWVFGVGKEDVQFCILIGNPPSTEDVHFRDGFLISTITPEILDALTAFCNDNSIFNEPRYFLSVNKDLHDKYSQEIKDVFSRTGETRVKADTATVIHTKNEYDILGNLLHQEAPKQGNTPLIGNTQYCYNTIGQLISKSTPDDGLIRFTYFNDGTLQYETTYNSNNSIVRELRYTYDELSRPILLKEYGPNISCQNNEREITTWIYDDKETATNKNIFKNIPRSYFSSVENTQSRLCAVIYTNYGAKKTSVGELFSYDDEGQLSFKITVLEGITGFQESRYEYDIHGKITAEYCFYNGEILKKRYTYDPLGRLADVYHCMTTDGGVTYTDNLIAQNAYDDLGVLTTKGFPTIPSGYTVGYTYDIRDHLTDITKPSNKPGFAEVIGGYDRAGNITNAQYKYFTNTSSAPTSAFDMTYTYDDIYRLKTVVPADPNQTAAYGASFSYNEVGHFITKQEGTSNLTGYEHYDLNNRLRKTSKNTTGDGYMYDDHGNCIIDFSKKMVIEYDWRNLPVTFRFYNTLPSGITKDNAGTCTNSDIYAYIKSRIDGTTVRLLSTVVMLYNAAGDRVGKLDFN